MTTAEALEAITDRALFERLATSVLRRAEPKYAGLIHTGINARGETIVAPIDGLHLIPHSDPPHYVFVQHTTTDRERLRGKWLSNADADLSKAIVEAANVRHNQPNATFTVVLTSNQRVDKDLIIEIYDAGHKANAAVDAWEQSKIAGFLDTDAEGHWLRKMYSVVREMLVRRDFRPAFHELESWFGGQSKEIQALRLLCRQGHVCRLDDRERRLDFRHDRLMEYFLARAMHGLLSLGNIPQNIVNDPYYSVIVGKVLSRTPVSAELLRVIRTNTPLAIFEAVRELGEPSNDGQELICKEAREWAASESSNAPESELTAICQTLIETASSRALTIIEAFRPNRLLMGAGLRNGSAEHGMRFIRGSVRHGFEPGATHTLRDRLIDHATRHHSGELAHQIRERMCREELPIDDVKAYLALVGHLRLSGIDDLIVNAWVRHQGEVLEYAIWAACRCPTADAVRLLRPMIDRLKTMPVRDDNTTGTVEREYLSQQLGWGFRRGITHEAVRFLVAAPDGDVALRHDVARMLASVDDPDAVEFLVRHVGSWEWRSISDNEVPTRAASPETNERLLNLWQSSHESNDVRTNAFCLWLQTTDCKDASFVRSVGADAPFYRYAVQHRIKLGDLSIASELVSMLRSDDIGGFWLTLAHRVWCNDVRSFVSERLRALDGKIPADFSGGRFDELYFLARLLVKIPVNDAQALLETNWKHLQYSPLMIQAAFRIGSPNCVRLAGEAIAKCPGNIDVFEHAFSSHWEEKNSSNPVTLRHLQNLEPFLHRLTDQELLFLAWQSEWSAASNVGIAEWIREHVVPRLPDEDRRRVDVADEMLLDYLDRGYTEDRFVPHLDIFFERQERRRVHQPERQFRVLDGWLSIHRTVRGLQLAAEWLKLAGSRQDLALLDRYSMDGDATEIERIKSDAHFAVYKRTLK